MIGSPLHFLDIDINELTFFNIMRLRMHQENKVLYDQPEYLTNQLIEAIDVIRCCQKWIKNVSYATKQQNYSTQQLTVEIKYLENMMLLHKKKGNCSSDTKCVDHFDILSHIFSETVLNAMKSTVNNYLNDNLEQEIKEKIDQELKKRIVWGPNR